jgi:hypothetical protein
MQRSPVNMTISLAFLAPNLVKAAVEGRLPRGIGIERLRDPPTEWSRLIRNSCSAGPKTPNYGGPEVGIPGAVRSNFALDHGRRERNFLMRRQGARNRS